eukprot:768342-Hanusia_phi.AAC.2
MTWHRLDDRSRISIASGINRQGWCKRRKRKRRRPLLNDFADPRFDERSSENQLVERSRFQNPRLFDYNKYNSVKEIFVAVEQVWRPAVETPVTAVCRKYRDRTMKISAVAENFQPLESELVLSTESF